MCSSDLDLSLEQLQRMRTICNQLVNVLDKIEPGLSRLRGFTLYQLHAAMYYITQKEFQAKTITKVQLQERLAEVQGLLKEAHRILSFDGLNTQEGVIAETIPKTIEDVETMLSQLCLNS